MTGLTEAQTGQPTGGGQSLENWRAPLLYRIAQQIEAQQAVGLAVTSLGDRLQRQATVDHAQECFSGRHIGTVQGDGGGGYGREVEPGGGQPVNQPRCTVNPSGGIGDAVDLILQRFDHGGHSHPGSGIILDMLGAPVGFQGQAVVRRIGDHGEVAVSQLEEMRLFETARQRGHRFGRHMVLLPAGHDHVGGKEGRTAIDGGGKTLARRQIAAAVEDDTARSLDLHTVLWAAPYAASQAGQGYPQLAGVPGGKRLRLGSRSRWEARQGQEQ
ncbi:hypothetical protein VPG91_29900 [Nitrospirillum amazonense]|nr:hypothetical protein [Nitrospirillum amazonense]MEC4595241.1 hypothetical protein [Nitrospirillum amazonense]